MNMFYIILPPAKYPFPLVGNKKGGFKSKYQCLYVTEILKYNIAIGTAGNI
jgi:hypothetical protein